MEFKDKVIVCKRCGLEFTWKAGEQEFYYDHNLSQPVKCPECRKELRLKLRRQQDERRAREEVQRG